MMIAFSSMSVLENWYTRLLHFLILPLIDVLLLALIYAQYADDFSYQVAVASVLVSGAVMAMTTFSGLLVDNRFRGVDRYVISLGGSPYYWWSQLLASALMAGLLTGVNLLLLAMFGAGMALVWRAFLLLPLLVLSGLVMGFVAFVSDWRRDNPYWTSNFLASTALVLSGSLIPITHYPPVFKQVASFFPVSGWLLSFYGDNSRLGHDALVLLIWLGAGFLIYGYQKRHIADKANQSLL